MGGSGTSIALGAVKGAKRRGRAELYDATRAFVVRTWKNSLPKAYAKSACQWIDFGLDSLLMVGTFDGKVAESEAATPDDEVTFWFYESVEWPQALAEHWLDLALIEGRKDFEKTLAKLGYVIADKKYPKKSEGHFIFDGKRIGHLDDDGVFWQLPEYGYTAYDALDAKTAALVSAAKKKKSCACPYCK